MNLDRRRRSAYRHSGHSTSTRAGAGGLRFAGATFEKTSSYVILAVDCDKFYIHALRKMRAALNFCRLRLPTRRKLRDERHIVRISHGDWNAAHFPAAHIQGEFILDSSLAHFDFELVLGISARSQRTDFHSRASKNRDFLLAKLRTNVSRYAACAVAGNLCWGPVSIDQLDFNIRGEVWDHPLNAVSTHAVMAVTDTGGEGCDIFRGQSAIDQ